MYLKKKRLSEDLLKAENSEDLRLFGELLTANLHLVQPGMRAVRVLNYYDGKEIEIPLDVKLPKTRSIILKSTQRPRLPSRKSRSSSQRTTMRSIIWNRSLRFWKTLRTSRRSRRYVRNWLKPDTYAAANRPEASAKKNTNRSRTNTR